MSDTIKLPLHRLYTGRQLLSFTAAAVAAERERCAKVCEARAEKIEADTERCKLSERYEVTSLRAMAWQLTVTAAAIRATEPKA